MLKEFVDIETVGLFFACMLPTLVYTSLMTLSQWKKGDTEPEPEKKKKKRGKKYR